MTWALPLTCSVVSRNTAGTAVDVYGNVTPANSGTVSVACDIQQIRRAEPGDEGELSVTEWMAFFPTGTVVDTSDQITEATLGTFEVVGDPWDANTGSAAVDHVAATLKKA
jgi:hypothetical protein